MTTIALCMIVKNEAHVIERCLRSALPHVTHAFISDTGSSDDTMDGVVRQCSLHRTELTLYVEPWVDFSTNRNSVIEYARAHEVDYMLFIDADEELRWWSEETAVWPELTEPAYWLPVDYDGTHYRRLALVSTKIAAEYKGVVHEYLEIDPTLKVGALAEPVIVVHHDGARSKDPDTYLKDADLLRKALAKDPTDLRAMYYLAQSYRDAGRLYMARDAYLHRASKAGWQEEAWSAMYEAAKITESDDPEQAVHYYLAAFQMHPKRAEPLYQLARYYRERGQWACAYLFALAACDKVSPVEDRLFIDASIYSWRRYDELGMAAYYSGDMLGGALACGIALAACDESERARIEANLAFYK